MRKRSIHLIVLALSLAACEGADLAGADQAVQTFRNAIVVNGPAPACTSDTPGDYQVLIYRDILYQNDCRILTLGLYPTDASLALPHDSISSFKVGSQVRFRAFRDGVYGGAHAYWNTDMNFLGGWDNAIGSARVEEAFRRADCNDLRQDEIALYEDFDYKGDCVVLSATQSYPTPKEMGIEDDSVSSFRNNSSRRITLWPDPGYKGKGVTFGQYRQDNLVPNSGCFLGICTSDGNNDEASSVSLTP